MKSRKQIHTSELYKKNEYMPPVNSAEYWFILGKPGIYASISENRLEHLKHLNYISSFSNVVIASKDINSGQWTKWKDLNEFKQSFLERVYEIHRRVLVNEIVIESDYESYTKNREASIFIGQILESRGFIPHYYYGGNKSLHIHIFLDEQYIIQHSEDYLDQLRQLFSEGKQFISEFVLWLRELIINKWSCNLYIFDSNFVNSSHLVRSELSRNKLGYKTFLGFKYTDILIEPYICNPQTTNYPEIATCAEALGEVQHKIQLSKPKDIDMLIQTFLDETQINKTKKDNARLQYGRMEPSKDVRQAVKFILSDTFAESPDGYKRAMFILINELLRFHSPETVETKMINWNERMGDKVLLSDIKYRINHKTKYKISNTYIYQFLEELGFKREEINKI